MSSFSPFMTTTRTTPLTTMKTTEGWPWRAAALLLALSSAALCASARPLNENLAISEPNHDVSPHDFSSPDAPDLAKRNSILETIAKRDSGSSSGSMTPQTWIPILVLGLVFGIFAIIACSRRNFRRSLGNNAAAQLGTDPDIAAARNPGTGQANGQGTQQRRRRPRRTPSQISTKSLPAYMKEPGEQELVIIRGPMDMDDEDDEVDVTDEAMALHRVETHATADTLPMASTTHLLRTIPTNESVESTTDSSAASHETASSLQPGDRPRGHQANLSADTADPRGDAPSYMEAMSSDNLNQFSSVNLNDEEPQRRISVSRALQQAAVSGRGSTADHADATVRDRRSRGSGLLSRLNPFSNAAAVPRSDQNPIPSDLEANVITPAAGHNNNLSVDRGHSRNLSNATTATTSSLSHDPHPRPSGQHRRGHSRGLSQALRTLRHPASNSSISALSHSHAAQMTSPSMISLNSISAPLTHTARRSEFYAPKGGLLTAEQVKLITSREALDKFGVPYGPDAVAYSASRVNVVPPPPFEGEEDEERAGGEGQEAGENGETVVVESPVQEPVEVAASSSQQQEESGADSDLAFGPPILPPFAPLSPVESVRVAEGMSPSNSNPTSPVQRNSSVRSMVTRLNSISDDSADPVARRMSTMSTNSIAKSLAHAPSHRSTASIAASDITSPSRRATIIAPSPASPSRRTTIIASSPSPVAETSSPSRRTTIIGRPASSSPPAIAPPPSAHVPGPTPSYVNTNFPERNSSITSTRSAFPQRTTEPARPLSTRSVRTVAHNGLPSPLEFGALKTGNVSANANANASTRRNPDFEPQMRAASRASTANSVSSFATAEQSFHGHGHGHHGGYNTAESEDDSGEDTEYDDADPGTPLTARSGTPTSVRRR